MKIGIRTSPVFEFEITKQEVEVLMELSEHHYDHRCKTASRQGGYLYGWKNHFWDGSDPVATISAKFDDLDTTLKIMEVANSLYRDENDTVQIEKRKLVAKFRVGFHAAINAYNGVYKTWVTEVKTGPDANAETQA